MSVVNKMLQDLEARENEASSISADYQPEKQKKVSPLLWGGVVVTLLVIAGVYLYPSLPEDSKLSLPGAEPLQSSTQATQPSLPPVRAEVTATSSQQPAENTSTPVPQVASAQQQTRVPEQSITESDREPVENPPMDVVAEVPEAEVQIVTEPELSEEASVPTDEAAPPVESEQSVFSVSSSQPAKSKQSLRELVQYALKNGEEQEAIGLLYRMLENQPANTGARKKLAAMLFARGQLSEAETVLSQGLERHPDNLQLRLMLARLYFQRNNLQQALETVKSDEVSAFLYPDFVSFRASLAEKLARYDIARQDYRALVESQPDEPRWWLGFAVSLERLNENMLALQAYEKTNTLGQLPDEVMQFVDQRIRYLTGS